MVSRRGFLKALAAGALWHTITSFGSSFGSSFGRTAFASAPPERSLSLYNIHTGERLSVAYFVNGSYDPAAVQSIDYLLRCHYTDEVKAIDVRTLDILAEVVRRSGKNGEVRIISGYRSPAYNDHLLSIGRGVSRNSLHLQGVAIDFALPGASTRDLFAIARSLGSGGVGYYPDFVHIDTGRVRYW